MNYFWISWDYIASDDIFTLKYIKRIQGNNNPPHKENHVQALALARNQMVKPAVVHAQGLSSCNAHVTDEAPGYTTPPEVLPASQAKEVCSTSIYGSESHAPC